MSKNIVILGGSYAGLHIAHYLLKHPVPDTKVILVSKNDHFFWNLATVRAIVPGQIKDEQIFAPLAKALERYPSSSYELVIGAATKADFDGKTVAVALADGTTRAIPYAQLVLATGSRCADDHPVPWKAAGSHAEAAALLGATRDRVAAASSYVVAGAGATGVEVAGELGFEYGKDRSVVLLSAGAEILGGDSSAGAARAELKKLGVKVRTGAKVAGTKALPDGKTEVSLEGGETITTDVYLPTMGLVPNSEYVDGKYLNDRGNVVVDEKFRVKGQADVWAAGDIVGKPRCGFMITQKHAAGVAKNVELVLKGKEALVVKDPPIDIFACAVGRGRGAGRLGPVKALSIMIWLAKGRTLAVERMAGYIDGSVA
ncbi:Apoptosis-inducing factor 1 [Pleurostoma richardsiae]|uniref:Apoptosis-inducing factor 1 n=1 Tax=Pleurostoma richardsiae TaxID=41990 RepID=A0AA38R6N9_9PEZI|nr:Apoptosis-inducing factor 1 [Pleurostoma richardsiae]